MLLYTIWHCFFFLYVFSCIAFCLVLMSAIERQRLVCDCTSGTKNRSRIQVMDDRWESGIMEYGAINITGFRIVDNERRFVKDFLEGWRRLDSLSSLGAGKDTISVMYTLRLWRVEYIFKHVMNANIFTVLSPTLMRIRHKRRSCTTQCLSWSRHWIMCWRRNRINSGRTRRDATISRRVWLAVQQPRPIHYMLAEAMVEHWTAIWPGATSIIGSMAIRLHGCCAR